MVETASDVRVDLGGHVTGVRVTQAARTVGDLVGVFADEAARAALPQERVAYRVLAHLPVPDGTPGGLFFGTSFIEPGDVGGEYFMTRGHFHRRVECGEYYWGIRGRGLLLLMGADRKTCAVEVSPGALHFIPGHTAHRLVNVGGETLVVGACWPSDAGHDYATIDRDGFSVRVFRGPEGRPRLVTVGGAE